MDGSGETDAAAEGRYVIRCRLCGRRLTSVSFPVVYRPKTRADLNLVRSGEHGAWCGDCKQVTVFVRHPRASAPQTRGAGS